MEDLYVAPSFRLLGLGELLMAECEDRLARIGYDWLYSGYHEGHRFGADLNRHRGFVSCLVGRGKWLDGRRGPHSRRGLLRKGRPSPAKARGVVGIRDYVPADRRFLEAALGDHLSEKAIEARGHDLVPNPAWGRRYARALINEAKKPGAVAQVVKVSGIRAGFLFAVPDRLAR